MDELSLILTSYHKRNRKVIRAFCDVDPKDLHHIESGCYNIAFENQQSNDRVSMEEIENWRKALVEASDLSGMLFKRKER